MEDKLVAVIPIHYTDVLGNDLHLHQFPLLARPLQAPPSAALAGKQIKARRKPVCGKTEVHVPLDVRPDVWNQEKGLELGAARAEADKASASPFSSSDLDPSSSTSQPTPRLSELRLRSDRIPPRGAYMLGVLKDDRLHLHPLSQTHQFRPSLEYLDVISRKSTRRKRAANDSDSDSDDGPPPDPDDPVAPLPPVAKEKKEKKKSSGSGELKEVTVTAKKTDEKGQANFQGGISSTRRDMLSALRKQEEEPWQAYEYCSADSVEARDTLASLVTASETQLICTSSTASLLKIIADSQTST